MSHRNYFPLLYPIPIYLEIYNLCHNFYYHFRDESFSSFPSASYELPLKTKTFPHFIHKSVVHRRKTVGVLPDAIVRVFFRHEVTKTHENQYENFLALL